MKSIIKYLLLPSAFLLHISLIFLHGYFLSIEFTLYPYLTLHGFLPYRDIIDQHFPSLLFGPFSLSAFLTTNPRPILALFLFVLCLTDLCLYVALVRFKAKQSFLWLIFYIVSSTFFSGNILWLETFINLFLAIWIYLSPSKSPISRFTSGFLLSQIILLRPTIFPAIFLLTIGLSFSINLTFLIGTLIGFLGPFFFLLRYGLLTNFYRLAFQFNQQVYPSEALLLPAKKQIVYLITWLAPAFYSLIRKRQFTLLLSLTLFLLLIVPRFGFEHLQPLILCTTFLWAIRSPLKVKLMILLVFILFVLNIFSALRHPYGNYFLTPDIRRVSALVSDLPGNQIYLLGASDLIYPLSGKLPPNFTYLPSLPWYFSQSDFVNKVINSLSRGNTWVLVDYAAAVDGHNLVESSGEVFKYIRMNFAAGQKIGDYQIFIPKP